MANSTKIWSAEYRNFGRTWRLDARTVLRSSIESVSYTHLSLNNFFEGKVLGKTKRATKSSVLQRHGKGDELPTVLRFKKMPMMEKTWVN